MKKSKFSEEQIVRILREVEAGAKVAETCRTHGISEPTYCLWKNKYAGMEVSQLRHLNGRRSRAGSAQAHVCRPGAGNPPIFRCS
jgi:transposase-like protein